MKIAVFLMQHYRKDKRNKHLAYIQTLVDIMVSYSPFPITANILIKNRLYIRP